jgi:hypothetical protein
MVAFLRPQLATITASRIRLLSRTPQAVKVQRETLVNAANRHQ